MTVSTSSHTIPSPIHTDTPKRAPAAARLVIAMLRKIQHGSLRLHLPGEQVLLLGDAVAQGHHAELRVQDWRVFAAILRGGDIAFAEAFMDGTVTSPHLPTLLKLMVLNRDALATAIYGTWWGSLIDRVLHLFRSNSKRQARKNIAAHYDLGNAFYTLWLDNCMSYSAALFDSPYTAQAADDDARLAAAQAAKYQRVLDELALPLGATVLEIGCGWGGFAEAAARAGHSSTGLTLSTEQLSYAKTRADTGGWGDKAEFKLQDYRDEAHAGGYAGIASIEMFEAVGEPYWPSYFECIARNLQANGRACVQTIVIDNALFERYRTGTDFIQRYIFPGGMLPSPAVFAAQAERAGLRVTKQHAFGLDYARTLAVWRARFMRQLDAVRAQGYPERFIRMWEFYLAYCEAGFVAGDINVVQFTLQKRVG